MNKEHPQWYYATVHRLNAYVTHKRRIAVLNEQIEAQGPKLTPVYTSQPRGSGTSDPTGNQGDRLLKLKAELQEREQAIRIIDLAVSMLSAPKKLIIEVRYLTDEGTDKAARLTLRAHGKRNKWRTMHNVTYQKLRDEAIKEIAEMLGEIDIETIQE
jgi:hypothetical protein